MFQLIYNTTGEDDEQCKVDCACCIDRKCGPGLYTSSDCTLGCIDGYFGARCYTRCTHNCTKCSYFKDACDACYDGYYPGSAGDCTSKCLPGCKTCTSGTTCTSCKEEYYNADGQNDCRNRYCSDNCNCESNQCVSCEDGYYNTSYSCNNLCPGNCVMCLSNTDCGSCKDGYYIGYQYDNINLSFLNDCTYKCRDNCIRCASYDSCSVCKTGHYGPKCGTSCSIGCKTNTCDTLTGNCACFPNFAGVRCDKCKIGKYGNMCDKQCPAGCKGGVCEKESGGCTDGCTVDTIVGDKCDVCSTSSYGQYCNISCSVGCKNKQCERGNGECSYGCLNNFDGRQCNQYMPDSSSTKQSMNTVVVILGTGFAVSVVVNIIFVVTLILWKCRKRVNGSRKTKGPLNVNSGIELECGNSANAGNVSNHRLAPATNNDTVLKSQDYQDLGSAQVSEHEYGQIIPEPGFH